MRLTRFGARFGLASILFAAAGTASAQDWKGMGRLEGKVLDPEGKPVAGATVKLDLPERAGGTTVTTDKNGRWAVGGIAAGAWNIDVQADGYAPRAATLNLPSEGARVAPIEITLEPAAPTGPPPEVMAALKQGDEAYKAGRWAEARVEYEKVLASLEDPTPETLRELRLQVARCHKQEGNYEKELEVLQQVADANPADTEVRALMAMEAIEGGMLDRGVELLRAVEGSIKSPDVFYNVGVAFRNKNKPEEAVAYFSRAVALDPAYLDGYFQRGLTYLGLQKLPEAKVDFERVLELSPDGPQAETARKALESLKG